MCQCNQPQVQSVAKTPATAAVETDFIADMRNSLRGLSFKLARANADRKAGRDTMGAGMVGMMVAMLAASSAGLGRRRL